MFNYKTTASLALYEIDFVSTVVQLHCKLFVLSPLQDYGFNSAFFWIFIDGAAGSFFVAFLWSAYNSAVDLDGSAASVPIAITVLQYLAFVSVTVQELTLLVVLFVCMELMLMRELHAM